MGSDGLQVVPAELVATAGQWQGHGAQLAATVAPPSAGPPFQPTTAAVNGVNAGIGAAATAFGARTQSTAAGVTRAAAGYTSQEATSAGEMGAVTGVTVV